MRSMSEPLEFVDKFEERRFYRYLIKAVEKYFEDPEVKKSFEEWKEERKVKEEQANGNVC